MSCGGQQTLPPTPCLLSTHHDMICFRMVLIIRRIYLFGCILRSPRGRAEAAALIESRLSAIARTHTKSTATKRSVSISISSRDKLKITEQRREHANDNTNLSKLAFGRHTHAHIRILANTPANRAETHNLPPVTGWQDWQIQCSIYIATIDLWPQFEWDDFVYCFVYSSNSCAHTRTQSSVRCKIAINNEFLLLFASHCWRGELMTYCFFCCPIRLSKLIIIDVHREYNRK